MRVDIYPTEEFMIKNILMGNSSIKIWNVNFIGTHEARGVFYSSNTPIPIDTGLLLSTGHAINVQGPNKGTGFTTSNRSKGDKDLHFLAQFKTYDATSISFDFTPQNNLIRFNYVFASEEYPEYVGSTFNDVFGFFLTDLETGDITNLAVIPNTELPITVNNINHIKHSNFYVKNSFESTPDSNTIEFDGMTQTLIAYSQVVPGRKYRMKIAIADVGDDAFDSGVFLEGNSFISEDKDQFFQTNSDYFSAFSNSSIKPQIISKKIPESSLTRIPSNIEKKDSVIQSSQTINFTKPVLPKLDSIIVYFDFDKSQPTANELKKVTEKLNQINIEKYNTSISGHTDQKGSHTYNYTLSQKRAFYIKNWILNNYKTNVISVKGYSFDQLAHIQTYDSARAKNRRVVIRFSLKTH
jgi:outer membrane protein OmpA-like peptidoglycan-associated protein